MKKIPLVRHGKQAGSSGARNAATHIPHPFFWVYDGFRGMLSRETWHGPIEPYQSLSLLLPDVLMLVWRLVSPRADTAGAQFPYAATPSPSRSILPVSVSQGTFDSCSGPSHRGIPSEEL
jgi:hypothetical protein